MGWGGPTFVLAIIAMGIGSWVITTWIRAKHGHPINDDWRNTADRDDELSAARQVELLARENEGLKGKVSRLEERLAVLERIATDPAERTAREIDNLR